MQIVTNIPDGIYDFLMKHPDRQFPYATEWIRQGKPLPKGHGDLIDVKELRQDIIAHKYSIDFCKDHNIEQSIDVGMLNILLADAPAIIPADKEVDE